MTMICSPSIENTVFSESEVCGVSQALSDTKDPLVSDLLLASRVRRSVPALFVQV